MVRAHVGGNEIPVAVSTDFFDRGEHDVRFGKIEDIWRMLHGRERVLEKSGFWITP
jgi:hypothetical protein